MIITIARTLGSGGRQIGEALAQRLGYKFYDKNLLAEAAERSGISAEFFAQADERAQQHPITGGLFGLRFPFLSGNGINNGLDNDTLFKLQSDTIRAIAKRENAVFLGRCADYVLREHQDCLRVFLYADIKDATRRVMERKQIDETTAAELIEKTNRQREAYYNHYASSAWGKAKTYDLCFNTSLMDFDAIVESLACLAQRMEK